MTSVYRISLEILSLANAMNKKVSYLVIDQTPTAFHRLGAGHHSML